MLPLVGLLLFGVETYHSVDVNRQMRNTTRRYFWWASARLDSDPLNKLRWRSTPAGCMPEDTNCTGWDLRQVWIDPGLLTKCLMISALPAFLIGGFVVAGLARLGVSEVVSFLALMPVFVLAWYYFLGWLVDRRRRVRPWEIRELVPRTRDGDRCDRPSLTQAQLGLR